MGKSVLAEAAREPTALRQLRKLLIRVHRLAHRTISRGTGLSFPGRQLRIWEAATRGRIIPGQAGVQSLGAFAGGDGVAELDQVLMEHAQRFAGGSQRWMICCLDQHRAR